MEKYADAKAWDTLGTDERDELVCDVAGLPSELVDEDQEAKQFDLLMLRLQLGLLRHEKSFTRWSEDVRQIAGALEEKTAIPMVRVELELIIEVQTDEFWQDVTTAMLEDVRKRLRSLVKFIERTQRPPIYTDFADTMGEETQIDLPGFDNGHDVERFREKKERFLKAHENDPVIHKLRFNDPLTKEDLDALEKMLIDAGTGTTEDISKVCSGNGLGLGLFVRSLVGLDREAAKHAFDGFLTGKTLTANQIQFVNLVIDYLTQAGWMPARSRRRIRLDPSHTTALDTQRDSAVSLGVVLVSASGGKDEPGIKGRYQDLRALRRNLNDCWINGDFRGRDFSVRSAG